MYVSNLSRELVELGVSVDVLAGQPYPELHRGVGLVKVPSLDLYGPPEPFRLPTWGELRGPIDLLEVGIMCVGGFPEPLTFSLRARAELSKRKGLYDLVHDNQSLGWGLLQIAADGWPLVETVHHPITVDRSIELATAARLQRRLQLRRWYGFVRMQKRVARRLPRLLTVSRAAAKDLAGQMGVAPERISVVPVGVDTSRFRPLPGVPRRAVVIATSVPDSPLKGLSHLLEAVSVLRRERDVELVVVGEPPRPGGSTALALERASLGGAVRFTGLVSQDELIRLYAEAMVAVVPSLYEGFSLPAAEAMACGVPLVATTAGGTPEVAGMDGETALLVEPGDSRALAYALGRVLGDPVLRARLSEGGRRRVERLFTWRACAKATLDVYESVLSGRRAGATQRLGAPGGREASLAAGLAGVGGC